MDFDQEDDLWQTTLDPADLWAACEGFRPREVPHGLIWSCQNLVNHLGRPYDHAAYPHLGAPGGPWDAFDASFVRTISLMFGSRLSKTFFGTACALFIAANAPAPMMHANATEQLTKQVMERGYEMIRRRESLLDLMASPHETDWRQTEFTFKACRLYGAWARSVSTLADKDILFGHAGEIDKWEQASTSKEADPLALFTDRFKNFQSVRKILFESTATLKGNSRIEAKVLAGSYCRLWVPCRHCQRFQILEFGSADSEGGLKFDRHESGHTDPATAFATAHYRCRFCRESLHDHDRPWMIRRGVWVPRGCEVDDTVALEVAQERMRPTSLSGKPNWRGWKESPWIKGVPARDGVDQSYQLSSLYALSLGWGDIAQEWAKSYRKPQLRRNFVNQWLGETWEVVRTRSTPEMAAERLGTQRSAGVVPEWGRFLTVSVDRQGRDGGYAVFVVEAHGTEDRAAVILHGTRRTLDEMYRDVCQQLFPHEDGGEPMPVVITVIDSGWNTSDTYSFCNAHDHCFALKGEDSDLAGEPYKLVELGRGVRSGAAGQLLLRIATDYWESELQNRIDNYQADQPGSLSLNRDIATDWDFISQLLNGVLTDATDRRGNDRLLWVKKNESDPNDYRDATRYGLAAAKVWLDNLRGQMPIRFIGKSAPVRTPEPESRRFVRPLTIRRATPMG